MDAIAAEAGVSKMTIYSNFGSKEGLFEAVVQDRTDRVMGGPAGVEALDPLQPHKALLAVGEQFLALTREEGAREMPDARENKALLREAVRVFMAAYAAAG